MINRYPTIYRIDQKKIIHDVITTITFATSWALTTKQTPKVNIIVQYQHE